MKPWRQTESFKIEMLPAGHGDCIYVEYGSAKSPHRVLIDGGPCYAFEPLSKKIKEMVKAKLAFDLLVVTHVDCDHIDGMIKLVSAEPENLRDRQTDIWFNSWLQFEKEPKDKLGPAQGEMMSALIEEHKLGWNSAFEKKAVANSDYTALEHRNLPGRLKLTLLSPTKAELAKLKPVWIKEVRKAGLEPGSREQALQLLRRNLKLKPPDLLGEKSFTIESLAETEFEPQTSETNASSIAFLAEYQGKKCLFAGDAQPDVLEASIQQLLTQRGKQRLTLDALKLSHHGSKHNTSSSLLQLLDCKRFLISSNGSIFRHPDRETIALIIKESRPNIELFFNYLSDETKIWRNDYLQRHYRYKAHYPQPMQEGLTVSL